MIRRRLTQDFPPRLPAGLHRNGVVPPSGGSAAGTRAGTAAARAARRRRRLTPPPERRKKGASRRTSARISSTVSSRPMRRRAPREHAAAQSPQAAQRRGLVRTRPSSRRTAPRGQASTQRPQSAQRFSNQAIWGTGLLRLRVGAPDAAQRAALEEDHGADAGAVVQREPLHVEHPAADRGLPHAAHSAALAVREMMSFWMSSCSSTKKAE